MDADTRRTAYYSYLPPGNYRFLVKAANRDDIWNEEGAHPGFAIVLGGTDSAGALTIAELAMDKAR